MKCRVTTSSVNIFVARVFPKTQASVFAMRPEIMAGVRGLITDLGCTRQDATTCPGIRHSRVLKHVLRR